MCEKSGLVLVGEWLGACDAGEDVEDLVVAGWGDLAEEEEFVHCCGLFSLEWWVVYVLVDECGAVGVVLAVAKERTDDSFSQYHRRVRVSGIAEPSLTPVLVVNEVSRSACDRQSATTSNRKHVIFGFGRRRET